MADVPTLINLFEVPGPEQDDAFLEGWERAGEFINQRVSEIETALHRSLEPEADFRFVNVVRIGDPEALREAIADPAFPGREMPFSAHPMLYGAVEEEGSPGPAVFINAFEVPANGDGDFTAAWRSAGDFLARQDGYLGRRLHQSLAPTDFRFVNIGWWESEDAYRAATAQPEFSSQVSIPFTGHPGLYEVIRT